MSDTPQRGDKAPKGQLCEGTRADGKPCTSFVSILWDDLDKGWRCAAHSTRRRHKVVRGGRKGRRVRDEAKPPIKTALRSAEDAADLLGWAAIRVAHGDLSSTAGGKIAAITRAFLHAREQADLEGKMEELEAELAELKRRGIV